MVRLASLAILQCPGENTVVDLTRGSLSAADAANVRAHLDTCPTCCALLAALCGTDTHAGLVVSPFALTEYASGAGPPSTSPPDLSGRNVGRYALKRLLGSGGMGMVYEAHDPKLNRSVAVKLLRARPSAGSTAPTLSLRMLREAQAMARLKHPNVVAVYDVGELEEQVFVAMELVPGGTLSTWLMQATRTWREILAIYIAAGRGLAAAHDASLIHRDFKPDNVLVGRNGEVRVTDFGLARSADDDAMPEQDASAGEVQIGSRLTHTGTLIGTPAYMSPEQLRREPATLRSDIFSFCAALYEALHGVRPFAGATIEELRANVVAGRIRKDPPRSRVPARVRRVLARGLCARPEERFASMHELLARLEGASRREARPLLVAGGVAVAAVVAVAALRGSAPRATALGDAGHEGNVVDPAAMAAPEAPRALVASVASPRAIESALRVDTATALPPSLPRETPIASAVPKAPARATRALPTLAQPTLAQPTLAQPTPIAATSPRVDAGTDDVFALPDEPR